MIRPRPSEADTLRLWLDVPGAVRTGEPVPIRLHVQNVSGRPLELHLRGRQIAFDLAVYDAEGETVWRRLEGAVIPGILRLEPLAPGDSLVLTHSWDQRSNRGEAVAPGAYIVTGEVLTDGEPLPASGVPLGITEPPAS